MKRDHHTVPRFYLKGFPIPDDPAFIWEYHRGTPFNPGHRADRHNPVRRALKSASVRTDYYGAYEDELAAREEHAKPVIEKLRATTAKQKALLTHAEKERLTDYLGLFIKRTTAREERIPAIWKTVLANERPRLELLARTLALHGRFGEAKEITDRLAEYEHGMPAEIRQRSTIEPYDLVRRRILDSPWTFITTTEPAFITSDNPIRFPEHEGLGHHLGFLTFPISTTIILFAGTETVAHLLNLPVATEDCGTAAATPDQIATLNHLTTSGAHHYLYAHEAREGIARSLG